MVYTILQKLIWWTLLVGYKKLHISGKEHIPKKGRVLIAMNHPAGFLEPVTLAGIYHRPLHYLVRGDVFKNKLLAPILRKTNQHPIYRFRDGFEDMKRNKAQMEHISNLLQLGHPILVYVEGSTEAVKKLRPLQKGLARLAHACLQQDADSPLYILPVGISFDDSTKLHGNVMVSIGQVLDARDYLDSFAENVNKGVRGITKDTTAAMKKHIVHLNDVSHTSLLDRLTHIALPPIDGWLPRIQQSAAYFDQHKSIADHLNQLDEKGIEALEQQVQGLTKEVPDGTLSAIPAHKASLLDYLLLIAGVMPALLGLICHLPPLIAARAFVKAKIKQPVFQGAILSVMLMAFTILYYIILIVIAAALGGWTGLLGIPIVFLLGVIAHGYSYVYRKVKHARAAAAVQPVLRKKAAHLLQSLSK